MPTKIVFLNDAGHPVIMTPVFECGLSIEKIAAKDVPAGKPFGFFEVADLPTTPEERDAWVIEEGDLTDGVGGVPPLGEEQGAP